MATELAKAYVQIVPSAQGIKGKIGEALGDEPEKAGKKAGEKSGHSFGKAIKTIIVAAGIGSVIKSAITEGSNYEQLTGGLETMFEDLAWDVEQNARNAYKTAGLSANEYMETVMGFSAALNASLTKTEGHIGRAADLSDQIIVDMADNANKMGSSMESIQNAYSGFAKGNYTMLDNLKLGYGGTREEMVRLLEDATKLSGVKYDISNFSDIAEAIHVVQTEMGITGTTAEEAASTVSGSLASMKSAWTNVLMAMTTGEDISGVLQSFTETVIGFAGNIIPMIQTVLTNLIPVVGELLTQLAPILVTDILPVLLSTLVTLAEQLAGMLPTIIPIIVQTVVDLINALVQALPTLLPALIPPLIQGLVDIGAALIENLPILLLAIGQALVQIALTLGELLGGLWNDTIWPWLSGVISSIGEWFSGIWSSITQWFGNIIQKVVTFFTNIYQKYTQARTNVINAVKQFFSNIWNSIVQWFTKIIQKVVSFVTSIPQKIRDGFSKVTQAGLDLVKGLWNGIKNATQWVLDKIKGFGQSILNGIKRIFGIGSPSKEMAYFGEMLDAGLAQGIEGNTRPISNAIDDITTMTTRGFSADLGVNSTMDVSGTMSGMAQLVQLVAALSEKVDHLQVWLDGDTLVGGISERMDGALGTSNTRKARGLA
ncbi:MAG: hypothetical protein IK082_05040 [Oscillospiraceae bacterium]|nr:hypothetical protein [Oscillospiraceae bacterium]